MHRLLSRFVASAALACAQSAHLPRGAATDVTSSDIQATLAKTPDAAVSDQAIRVVSINDEYNVGVGVVHRATTHGPSRGGAIEHSQITEIYHVMEGRANVVFGEANLPQPVNIRKLLAAFFEHDNGTVKPKPRPETIPLHV